MSTCRVQFTDAHGISRTVEVFTRAIPRTLATLARINATPRRISPVDDSPYAPDHEVGDIVTRNGTEWRVIALTDDGHLMVAV